MTGLDETTQQSICDIINSALGMNIGTGLQAYLEEKINGILPDGLTYYMEFDMSGSVSHHIKGGEETITF